MHYIPNLTFSGNCLNFLGIVLILVQILRKPRRGEIIMFATEALPILFAFGTYLFNMSVVGVVRCKELIHIFFIIEVIGHAK